MLGFMPFPHESRFWLERSEGGLHSSTGTKLSQPGTVLGGLEAGLDGEAVVPGGAGLLLLRGVGVLDDGLLKRVSDLTTSGELVTEVSGEASVRSHDDESPSEGTELTELTGITCRLSGGTALPRSGELGVRLGSRRPT